MPTIVNRSAAHREITSDYEQLKQLEGINNDLEARNKNEVAKNRILLMGDSHMRGYA
jgi:hypothetical protein